MDSEYAIKLTERHYQNSMNKSKTQSYSEMTISTLFEEVLQILIKKYKEEIFIQPIYANGDSYNIYQFKFIEKI